MVDQCIRKVTDARNRQLGIIGVLGAIKRGKELMLGPIKIIEIELGAPLPDLSGLAGYFFVQALVRWHGVPVGYVRVPVSNGGCSARSLGKAILDQHSSTLVRLILRHGLQSQDIARVLDFKVLLDGGSNHNPHTSNSHLPSVTVAVCTRNRIEEMARCLSFLEKLDYPNLDILVVDNEPATDSLLQLVKDHYPQFRYVKEPRPGLSWARNRAISESSSEIIAFTDDDVIVDPGWVRALVATFSESPDIAAVTGLIAPYELETEPQLLFELRGKGGLGLGFERRLFRYDRSIGPQWKSLETSQCGAGANMAFKRSIFGQVGLFDTALGAGTICGCGEDVQMFFRVLNEGHSIVYEPSALVHHRHRSSYEGLRRQLAGYGGTSACYAWGLASNPGLRLSFAKLIFAHLFIGNLAAFIRSILTPSQIPPELFYVETLGAFSSLFSYKRSQQLARQIEDRFGAQPPLMMPATAVSSQRHRTGAVAVRHIDVAAPLCALTDLAEYSTVRLYVWHKEKPLGSLDIANKGGSVGVSHLIDCIVGALSVQLISPSRELTDDQRSSLATFCMLERFLPDVASVEPATRLPSSIPVTIVVPTCNRPDELKSCLTALRMVRSERAVEVIVVDNNPDSSAALNILAEFPHVKLLTEHRSGASYARNAGIAASSGEIIAFIDDDTRVPSDWLENLLAPFVRADVMAVSGNILPRELEAESQRLFESYGYGGLNRGYMKWDADSNWFYKKFRLFGVPMSRLGGTGNVAFRASAFCDPKIGLMDESLGPGRPAGIGEDMYLFYRTIRAGWTIVYEPAACLVHTHRRTLSALRKQLFRYGQGTVSYQLFLILREFDLRAVVSLFVDLPLWHARRIYQRLTGRSSYPLTEVLVEIAGGLCGPVGLLISYLQVLRRKRSAPYIPPFLRTVDAAVDRSKKDEKALMSGRR